VTTATTRSLRLPVFWGVAVGVLQAASPLAFPWLDAADGVRAGPGAHRHLVGHGVKDMWQDRTRFVANTRWWPPFCAAVDFVAAGLIAVLLAAGLTA
jgi:hypothetical protein